MFVCFLLLLILLSSCGPCILSWCRLLLLRWLLLFTNIIPLPFSTLVSIILLFPFSCLPCAIAQSWRCYIVIGCFTYSTLRDYLHNHASTCHGGQRYLCVWLLFVFYVHYYLLPGVWVIAIQPNVLPPKLDSSITHTTRDTRDKRQLTCTLARIFLPCRLSYLFLSIFMKMNFPGV